MNAPQNLAPLVADQDMVGAFLEALFAPTREVYPNGLVEIRFGMADPNKSAYFNSRPDGIAEAAAYATNRNREGANVYVGVNPRKPGTRGTASDDDVQCAFWQFGDLDKLEAIKAAAEKIGALPPSMTVYTGTMPNPRTHRYWQLSTPVGDMDAWRERQSGIRDTLKGDSVINPSRIMRVAGCVNFPSKDKQGRGYVAELITFDPPDGTLVTVDEIANAFPRLSSLAGDRKAPGQPSARIEAILRGDNWHNNVRDYTARLVRKGLETDEILLMADGLTMPGYTVDETVAEMRVMIDGARRKGWDEAPTSLPEPPPPEDGDPGPQPEGLPPGLPITADCIEPVPDDLVPTLDLAALATTRAKPTRFAIDGVAPLGEVFSLTGEGGAGKSLMCQQFATAAAAALGKCLGIGVISCPALYLTCEDDAKTLHWRQERICEALAVPMDSLAGKLHLAALRGVLGNELATFATDGRLTVTDAYRRLERTVKAIGAGIVFLDNVAHLFAGNENDRGEVTRFVNLLNGLAGETGASIVLVGHPNKKGDDYSGSTGWNNAVRARGFLDYDADTDTRTFSLPKANYSRNGDICTFRWWNGAFVRDEDLPADTRMELGDIIRANGENNRFLECLAAATASHRNVSHQNGSNYAPKIFAAMPEAKGMKVKAFEAAMERLLSLGKIELNAALWQDAHRKWKQGIRAVEKCGNPPAATPCGDLRQPPVESGGNASGDLRAAPPLYINISGAAHEAAAPDDYDDEADSFDVRD